MEFVFRDNPNYRNFDQLTLLMQWKGARESLGARIFEIYQKYGTIGTVRYNYRYTYLTYYIGIHAYNVRKLNVYPNGPARLVQLFHIGYSHCCASASASDYPIVISLIMIADASMARSRQPTFFLFFFSSMCVFLIKNVPYWSMFFIGMCFYAVMRWILKLSMLLYVDFYGWEE